MEKMKKDLKFYVYNKETLNEEEKKYNKRKL